MYRGLIVQAQCGAHSPVDADGAQVEDAGSAHHHIQRDKDVAVHATEKPGPSNHLQKNGQEDYQRPCCTPMSFQSVKWLLEHPHSTCDLQTKNMATMRAHTTTICVSIERLTSCKASHNVPNPTVMQ